jgi:CBS domain-containing protein
LVGIITERDIIRMVDQLGGEKLVIGGEEEVRVNLIDQ